MDVVVSQTIGTDVALELNVVDDVGQHGQDQVAGGRGAQALQATPTDPVLGWVLAPLPEIIASSVTRSRVNLNWR